MKNVIISSVLLFGGHVAESAVIIRQDTVAVSPNGRDPDLVEFDINEDGEIDWSLSARQTEYFWGVNARSVATTAFLLGRPVESGLLELTPLKPGEIIGDSLETVTYEWHFETSLSLLEGSSQHQGGYFFFQEGYLGFQFQSEEGMHFGYAYLFHSGLGQITVTELAWETEPGKAIRAGNIPEPTTSLSLLLALLAATQIRRR